MRLQNQQFFLKNTLFTRRSLLLVQFFLIVFIYHTLKDLKDSLVITASDAGAEVIPFIKIWGMLPLAIIASYLFTKAYQRFGREKAFYLIVGGLLSSYLLFAFCLYPLRDLLYFSGAETYLTHHLPRGCRGLISIVSFWIFSFFYLFAELWSLLILSVLFWGYVNEITSKEEAKTFYPLCTLVANCAGILAGQISHFFCHTLVKYFVWEQVLQGVILLIGVLGVIIMGINRVLALNDPPMSRAANRKTKSSFREAILSIFQSRTLLYIAILVVGFAFTSNLIEVTWKGYIKQKYPLPQDYNAYMNQITTLIGTSAVIMSLVSRWLFKRFSWSVIALITPTLLFITSSLFFSSIYMPGSTLGFILTLGSLHYIVALTAKYTIFDTTKEISFLSLESQDRIRAKSVIDTIGSRLGKSGSSCIYQLLLIVLSGMSGHVLIIACFSIFIIGNSIWVTRKLGNRLALQDRQLES